MIFHSEDRANERASEKEKNINIMPKEFVHIQYILS